MIAVENENTRGQRPIIFVCSTHTIFAAAAHLYFQRIQMVDVFFLLQSTFNHQTLKKKFVSIFMLLLRRSKFFYLLHPLVIELNK